MEGITRVCRRCRRFAYGLDPDSANGPDPNQHSESNPKDVKIPHPDPTKTFRIVFSNSYGCY
jgi:hypothetical protein